MNRVILTVPAAYGDFGRAVANTGESTLHNHAPSDGLANARAEPDGLHHWFSLFLPPPAQLLG